MDIVVFYDGCFEKAFRNTSTTRIRALMTRVEEIFSEYDSLETIIKFQDDFPIVPKLESSWCNKNWTVITKRDGELGLIAERPSNSAHAYIFITHRSKERILDELDEGISPIRGIAATGSACSTGIGIIEYLPDSARNSSMQNAEVFC